MPKACNFIKKETPAQVFSCEFCEIFKNTHFYKTSPVAACICFIICFCFCCCCCIIFTIFPFFPYLAVVCLFILVSLLFVCLFFFASFFTEKLHYSFSFRHSYKTISPIVSSFLQNDITNCKATKQVKLNTDLKYTMLKLS